MFKQMLKYYGSEMPEGQFKGITMTFNGSKPGINDDLSVSQGDIQGNFAQANTSMGIDHFDFENVAGDTGKHKYTTFVDIASTTPATAAPVTTADELAFFVKQVGSDPRIHFRQISNGTEVQLTGADPIITATGETFLPGGLGLKWGTFQVTAAGPKTFAYVADLSLTAFTTDTYRVLFTPRTNYGNRTTWVSSSDKDGFSIEQDGTSTLNFDWIAIGL